VPCLCNDLSTSACVTEDVEDDRCEFIQSVVTQHKPQSLTEEKVKSDKPQSHTEEKHKSAAPQSLTEEKLKDKRHSHTEEKHKSAALQSHTEKKHKSEHKSDKLQSHAEEKHKSDALQSHTEKKHKSDKLQSFAEEKRMLQSYADEKRRSEKKLKAIMEQYQHKDQHQHKGKAFPDVFGNIGDVVNSIGNIVGGTADLQDDVDNVTTQVENFATVVTSTIQDLKSISPTDSFTDIITQVDTSGHTIWTSLKSVLDAIAQVGTDFDNGVGALLPSPNSFKSFLDNTIAAIVAKGDSLQTSIDLQLSTLGADINQTCAVALTEIQTLEAQAANLSAVISNLTQGGMQSEVQDLLDLLPSTTQTEINNFVTKAEAMATNLQTTVTDTATEIYNGFGLALQNQCPDFASLDFSLAPALKVGMATAIAVSAAALSL
jgi:hypothetical protein